MPILFMKNLLHNVKGFFYAEAPKENNTPDPVDGLRRSDCEERPAGGYVCPGCNNKRKVRIKHVGVCGYCVSRMIKENVKNIEKVKAYPKGEK